MGTGLLAALLASCVSIGSVRGYAPVEPFEAYEGALPPGLDESAAVRLPEGVVLLVHAGRREVHPMPGTQITLDVHLLVPLGVGVELLDLELSLASPAWPEQRRLAVVCIEDFTAVPRSVQPADAVLRGTQWTGVYPGFGLSFVDQGPRSQTRIPAVEEFTVQLPVLRIQGTRADPGRLSFRAGERSGVSLAVD